MALETEGKKRRTGKEKGFCENNYITNKYKKKPSRRNSYGKVIYVS